MKMHIQHPWQGTTSPFGAVREVEEGSSPSTEGMDWEDFTGTWQLHNSAHPKGLIWHGAWHTAGTLTAGDMDGQEGADDTRGKG